MEITQKEYVEQLYKSEIKLILGGLVHIEKRLTELKLHRFATEIKAIAVALSVEELGEEYTKHITEVELKKVK
jgi:hypothetical protein